MTERYYIDTQGTDDNAHLYAISRAVDLAKVANIEQVILLISSKRDTAWLDRPLTPTIVKNCWKGLLHKGVILKLETLRNYTTGYPDRSNDIVVAHGLKSTGELDKLNAFPIKAIIWVPWSGLDRNWARTWNATELKNGHQLAPFELPDPLVCVALDEISYKIDKSAGSFHASDEIMIREYGAILNHKIGFQYDAIEAYLTREKGWPIILVTKLTELFRTSRQVTGGANRVEEIVARWHKTILEKL